MFDYFAFLKELGTRQMITNNLVGPNIRYDNGAWWLARNIDSQGITITEETAKRLVAKLKKLKDSHLECGIEKPLTPEELVEDALFYLKMEEDDE